MRAPYSALVVAELVINYCNENQIVISNLKLQKMLYFIQADFLVNTRTPCFDEEIEAWNFGPVVPEVYIEYKSYGSSNIPHQNDRYAGIISVSDQRRIMTMVDKCKMYSTSALVEITHRQDPWRDAFEPYRSNIITKDSIRKYFSD